MSLMMDRRISGGKRELAIDIGEMSGSSDEGVRFNSCRIIFTVSVNAILLARTKLQRYE